MSNSCNFFIFLSLGVAENLCKLFVTDNGIDMTPILRRSKESARRQRSRPESERSQDIPNTRPLAERARPTLPNRKRPFQRYYYSYFSLFSFFFHHTIWADFLLTKKLCFLNFNKFFLFKDRRQIVLQQYGW